MTSNMATGAGAGGASHQAGATYRTIRVGGLPIAVLDRKETAVLTIDAALSRKGRGQPCLLHTTANGQVISMCASEPDVRRLYEQADLISPDGMSTVFASRLLCPVALPERVATTDAFHDVASEAERRGASFFFLGATEEVIERAALKAQALYPRLKILGSHHGHFGRDQDAAVADHVNRIGPDILWVGMGVPRQQHFILGQRERMTNVGIAKTCGGLFDFLSGKSSRAPGWMQAAGLEWLYRFANEPRRLGMRYLKSNPHALYVMLTQSGRVQVQ